jgi:hypothetical protein
MNGTRAPSLEERRANLVSRLQAQRRVIEAQLGEAPLISRDFPRSVTMRALTQHPNVVLRTAWDLLGLFRSGRKHSKHS